MSARQRPVYTIGHSTHTIEAFVGLLRRHSVSAVVDVRSAPFSRFNPQFNKNVLEVTLKSHGIIYVFLGRELGARSDDPACYENGRVRYPRLAQSAPFVTGVNRVVEGALKYTIAMMCAEKEPLECHRTLLVSRALVKRGMEVEHILADGTIERYDRSLVRLLKLVGLPQEDLFRTKEQLIEEAMARQEERIAYVDEKLTANNRSQSK